MTKEEFIKQAQANIRETMCFEIDYSYHDGFLMDYPEEIEGEDSWDLYIKVLKTAHPSVTFDKIID